MSVSDLKLKIDNKIWLKIRDYFYNQRVAEATIIQNINNNCNPDQKKALICYMTFSFSVNLEETNAVRTQPFEILKIVNVFTQLGYSIDIIGCNDLKAIKVVRNKKYDFIFGFGEAFYQLTNLQPKAISVLYLTEQHPEFSFREEKRRLDYYFERHGRRLKITRSGKFYKKYQLEKAYSHTITIGTSALPERESVSSYSMFPTGLINNNFVFHEKAHEKTRKQFLWLGSTGAIHKGLDLLLDVFYKRNDIVLHICGLSKEERRVLKLKKRENIIDHGHVNINSGIFLELTDICSFIILPSCSEGFSTSITTGMLHGLIPVVNKNTGFNILGDKAIFLDDFKIEYIDLKLSELSTTDPRNLALLGKQVFDFARFNFTITNFENSFRLILTNLL